MSSRTLEYMRVRRISGCPGYWISKRMYNVKHNHDNSETKSYWRVEGAPNM